MRDERKRRIGNYRASYSRNRVAKIATKTAAAVACIPGGSSYSCVAARGDNKSEEEREREREEESAQVNARRKVDARQHQSLHLTRSLIHARPRVRLEYNVQGETKRLRSCSATSRTRAQFVGALHRVSHFESFLRDSPIYFPISESRRRNKSRRNDEIIYR